MYYGNSTNLNTLILASEESLGVQIVNDQMSGPNHITLTIFSEAWFRVLPLVHILEKMIQIWTLI